MILILPLLIVRVVSLTLTIKCEVWELGNGDRWNRCMDSEKQAEAKLIRKSID